LAKDNENNQIGVEQKTWYFFRLQELVFEDDNLDTYDKAIYAVISRYSDLDTRICYPSMKTIAKKASCSVNKARKSVNKLVEAGYITKELRKNKKGNFNSNLYKIKDLSYISNAINYAKENSNNRMLEKINEELKDHPIPDEKKITEIKYKYESDNNSSTKSEKPEEMEKLYEAGYR